MASDDGPAVHRSDRVMAMGGGVRIDTSYFTAGSGRRPAVLIGHGFGGSKDDVRPEAEKLARDGYAVLTWSARGFGRSSGRIGLNDPEGEVADVSKLIDWLAARPEVRLDKAGDPRVGVTGASYGGAVSLLAAGHDPRVDAIAPSITYWNLADALFPNGVFKKLWAGCLHQLRRRLLPLRAPAVRHVQPGRGGREAGRRGPCPARGPLPVRRHAAASRSPR